MELNRGLRIGPRLGFLLAAAVFGVFAFVLFAPYAGRLSSAFRLLFALNPAAGALGVFLLSRRWLAAWMPGVLAGLFYGFGPFGLSFMGFHPIAGLTFAAVPWLLLPAVYWRKGQTPTAARFAMRMVLCVLPFLFIIVFFWVFSQHWIGPVVFLPERTMLSRYDFAGLVFPLSMTGRPIIFGVYHTGILAAVMGLFVYLSVQRVTVLIPALAGLVLSFLDPVLRVSPVIWVSLPMVFLAILAGLGVQAMLLAGKTDSKWLMICTLAGLITAGVSMALYLPDRPEEYALPAVFYLLVSAGFAAVFVLSRWGIRGMLLRWVLIAGIAGADCYWCARWLVARFI